MKRCAFQIAFWMVLIACMAQELTAQKRFEVDFGVRGGALLGQPLQSNPYSGQHPFPPTYSFDNVYGTLGPTVGLKLYSRLDIRFEAVYKRFGYQWRTPPASGLSVYSTAQGHSWEYPLLATYRFGSGKVRPFLGGGLNLGGTAKGTSTDQFTDATSGLPVVTTLESQTTHGLPMAYHIVGGVEWRFTRLSIRPELRYTRWNPDTTSGSIVSNRRNQFEPVFGITFQPFQSGSRLKH